MKNITNFSEALRNARKEIYTNGEDMAHEIGWSEKTYRQYEKDDKLLPPPDIALKICKILNRPSLFINYLNQLFEEEGYAAMDLKWFLPLFNTFQDLREAVLTTIKEIRDVTNLEHTIIDISLDGKISNTEKADIYNYLREVNDLIDALMHLKLHLEQELQNETS
ncbi:MAG: helix-turn-helix domain-containing protein [bacterium]